MLLNWFPDRVVGIRDDFVVRPCELIEEFTARLFCEALSIQARNGSPTPLFITRLVNGRQAAIRVLDDFAAAFVVTIKPYASVIVEEYLAVRIGVCCGMQGFTRARD
jgi:hypothetical protein